MKDLTQSYLEQSYTVVRLLKEKPAGKIELVTHQGDGTFYVKKTLARVGLPYEELRQLKHPLLPKIYAVAEAKGTAVIIEEFINGTNMSELVPKAPGYKALITEGEIKSIGLQVCSGLALLHQHHIIHRDIKPGNLILLPDGRVKLIDFDAARIGKEQASGDTRLLGTEGYAPPEQYGFAQTDERSDIYALGKTLEQLAGPSYRGPLKAVFTKATSLAPKDRYPTAMALEQALKGSTLYYWAGRIGCVLLALLTLGLGYDYWRYGSNADYSDSSGQATPSGASGRAHSFLAAEINRLKLSLAAETAPAAGLNTGADLMDLGVSSGSQGLKTEAIGLESKALDQLARPKEEPLIDKGIKDEGDNTGRTATGWKRPTATALQTDSNAATAGRLTVTFTAKGNSLGSGEGAGLALIKNNGHNYVAGGQRVSIAIANSTNQALNKGRVKLWVGDIDYKGSYGGDIPLQVQGRTVGNYMLQSSALPDLQPGATLSLYLNFDPSRVIGSRPFVRVLISGENIKEQGFILNLL